jgi:aryl-alcohol dehydrogenase-like predicted oxidoreductase
VVRRDDVVLATKAGISRSRGVRETNASRGYLIATLDASLKRLGVDHVDLWQVHTWVDDTPLEETLSALDYAVASGRASYVGVSNYSGWQSAQAATWQRAVPGRATLASTQVEYSLLNRRVEAEVLPAAAALGLGVLPWSPLGRGVLTGKYRTGTPADSRAASPHFSNFVGSYLDDRCSRIVEAVVRAADGLDLTPLEVALAWVRDRAGVTAPIVGARTAAQLKGSLTVEDVALPPEIVAALDDVSDLP